MFSAATSLHKQIRLSQFETEYQGFHQFAGKKTRVQNAPSPVRSVSRSICQAFCPSLTSGKEASTDYKYEDTSFDTSSEIEGTKEFLCKDVPNLLQVGLSEFNGKDVQFMAQSWQNSKAEGDLVSRSCW